MPVCRWNRIRAIASVRNTARVGMLACSEPGAEATKPMAKSIGSGLPRLIVLVGECGRGVDDEGVPYAGEVSRQTGSQPIGDIGLAGIAGEICERQHDNREGPASAATAAGGGFGTTTVCTVS